MTTSPASFADSELERRVRSALDAVRATIARSSASPEHVTIVAVTKGFPLSHVHAAAAAGLADVGENYAREMIDKAAACERPVRWHFIGALQSNKIASICAVADVIEGVARDSELDVIARQARRPTLYVQVDYTGSPTRHGAREADVAKLVRRARELNLDVRGLMTVASPERSEALTAFASLSALADALELPVRSMGMSDDLEAALSAGSTEVRVGRALFGPRPGAGSG